jgi:hypothetical protein
MRERSILSIVALRKKSRTMRPSSPSDQQLKDASLEVVSTKGEVTLSGTVSSDAAHLDANKIASQTPGVVKVDDQIVVETARIGSLESLATGKLEAKPGSS